MPGLNKLNYNNSYWPYSIDKVLDEDILSYVEEKLWLIQLPMRQVGYDVFQGKNINKQSVLKLADATEQAWQGLMARDTEKWGINTRRCFEAQVELFPNTITAEAREMIERYKNVAYGWKLTGAGGGGYLILISDQAVENAIKVRICRGN